MSSLSGVQMRDLITLVSTRDEQTLDAWANPPQDAIAGATIYQSRQCSFCHTLNGEGGEAGPVLNGLSARREYDWVAGHFGDPKAFVPTSRMPSYQFNDEELSALTGYLMSIPK